jgi:hypothetical protein
MPDMIIDSIHHQQIERMTQSSALRKAASGGSLPLLSEDEVSMIHREFASPSPSSQYNPAGDVEHEMWPVAGCNLDRRV